jgi:hypothetical protein
MAASVFLMTPIAGLAQQQDPVVGTSLGYTKDMFSRQDHVTDKIPLTLKARRSGQLQSNRLCFWWAICRHHDP